MRKNVYGILVVMTCLLLLVSCGDSSADYNLSASANNAKNNEVVLGVSEIGTITLDSKEELESLRDKYEGLTEKEKKNAIDYDELTEAENQYWTLVKEKEEADEAERKAAEEAELERLAAEAAEDQYEQMVWIPRTGSKYHSKSSCSNMKDPSQVTLSQAERLGYEPCKKCY